MHSLWTAQGQSVVESAGERLFFGALSGLFIGMS